MDDLKIENPSGSLVLDAIKGVPIVPKYVSVRMVSNGVPPPKYEDAEDRKRYLADCAVNSIMPWTSLEFEFNRDTGVMVPKDRQEITYVSSLNGLEEAIQSLIKGGKFHKIYLESYGINLFSNFLKKVSEFSGSDYVPHILSMDITQYHMTGYNYGDYGDTVLSLSYDDMTGDSVLNLKMGGSNTSDEQREKLKSWFFDLQKAAV